MVKHLYKEGGIRSVFRGSVATIARDGPGSAAYFAAYEVTKGFLSTPGSTDLNLGAVIVAGGTAGVAMWSIAIPPDVRVDNSSFGAYAYVSCYRLSSRGSSLRHRELTLVSLTVRGRRLL